jgi:hypothetical protein
VRFVFDDAHDIDVGTIRLTPVTRIQRQNQTKFLLRTRTGTVPKTARVVYVSIVLTNVTGVTIDGYADNLSLVLRGI